MKIKARSHKVLKENIRWHALILLDKIENNNEYSNVVINHFLDKSEFDERDNNLLVQIVYGAVQNRCTIDYYLQPIIQGKKIDQWILTLLRMSVYQLVYLDRIPSYAVVNEAVLIAKTNSHQQLGKFVNALLRNFMRQPLPDTAAIKDVQERISIQYSVDRWIVDYFSEMLPNEELETLFKSIQQEPYLSARINSAKEFSRADIVKLLEGEGVKVIESNLSPEGMRVVEGNILQTQAFSQGLVTIQDESSMMVVPLGQIEGSERILDACAAPGGKTTHIASKLTNGRLTALDISAAKLNIVNEHLERMDLSQLVNTIAVDATKFKPDNDELYDIIYLDAPCSGLGLMRRKPEIKYEKSLKDVHNLAMIQKELLKHTATLLKPGGKLIYSTCTMTVEENEHLIDWFLKQESDFIHDEIKEAEGLPAEIITEEGNIRIWPQQFQTDGFFMCRLVKKDKRL